MQFNENHKKNMFVLKFYKYTLLLLKIKLTTHRCDICICMRITYIHINNIHVNTLREL